MPLFTLPSILRCLVFVLAAASAGACAQTTITLRLSEAVTVPSVGRVTFIHAEDERCPVDVHCIAAGSAYALLWVELGTKKGLVAVQTSQRRLDLEVENRFFGTEFCLISLEPRPSQAKPVHPHSRIITLLLRQNSSSNSTCPSGA